MKSYISLTPEEKALVHATLTWVRLRMLHERHVRQLMDEDLDNAIQFVTTSFSPDLDHSSLFARLINGKDPLPVPPPRAYSYPWYDLVENGEAILHDFDVYGPSTYPGEIPNEGKAYFNICQGLWEILEYQGDGSFVVQYDENNGPYRLSPDTAYSTKIEDGKPVKVPRPGWLLKKVEE